MANPIELGSGYRNSEHYTRLYTVGSEVVFEEGDIFKTLIPLKTQIDTAIDGAIDGAIEGAIKGAIDGATITTKRKLSVLLKTIATNEGKRTPEYKEITKLGSERTLERYIEQLKDAGFIHFKGDAPQTGGYFITDKLKKIIGKELPA